MRVKEGRQTETKEGKSREAYHTSESAYKIEREVVNRQIDEGTEMDWTADTESNRDRNTESERTERHRQIHSIREN